MVNFVKILGCSLNDLSRVDASKILVIDFVNGIGQCFPVALPGLPFVAEKINIW